MLAVYQCQEGGIIWALIQRMGWICIILIRGTLSILETKSDFRNKIKK